MLQLVQHGAALSRSGLRLQRGADFGGVECAGQQQAVDLDCRAAGLDERFDAGLDLFKNKSVEPRPSGSGVEAPLPD